MKNKKEIIMWANDDWINLSKEQFKDLITTSNFIFNVFHKLKHNSYEGLARKVKITIEEI